MWKNGNMYGGFYDRAYGGYNPNAGGSTMIAPPANTSYGQPYNQLFGGNTYNPRRLQPIQPQAPPQPQMQECHFPNKDSQIRRLSRPNENGAAHPRSQSTDSASSYESSLADTALPLVLASSSVQPQTYASQPPKRFGSAQPYTLQRGMRVRSDGRSAMSAYAMPAQNAARLQGQQQQRPMSSPGLQARGSFRRSGSTLGGTSLDAAAFRRIDSGFDSRPDGSFRMSGGLDRQYSNLDGYSDFYKYTPQNEPESTGTSVKYSNGAQGASLQRDGGGSASLYRMYSFSNPEGSDTMHRGLSTYGSIYGGQNTYGGGGIGNTRNGTSLYGTMSSANLRPTYSFAGSSVQGYGSGFALLDGAAEENEFGGGQSVTESGNAYTSMGSYASKSESTSPVPSITPPIRTSGSSQRPRSQSAPACRPAPPQSSLTNTEERPGSGRRRRQRPQKRINSEEDSLPVIMTATKLESPPPLPPVPEETLAPIRRRSSAPVNATRPTVTPFEQMRALRRVQTSAYDGQTTQPTPLSSTIGRRRGTNGGLHFSGAAVV